MWLVARNSYNGCSARRRPLLKATQFQVAVSILFVTYILSELPSNLVLKKLRPPRWIAFITVSWGIIATLIGVIQNYASLIVCYLFLGAVEGSLLPSIAVYLTLFYTRRELALRIGYLFVSAVLAGGSWRLRLGICKVWRAEWVEVDYNYSGHQRSSLELLWWILLDNPATAYFLDEQGKELAAVRLTR